MQWRKKHDQNNLSRWCSPVSKREPACDPIFQRKYSLSDIRHATQYLHLENTEKLNCKLFEGLVDCKPTIITTLEWQLFYLQWQFESEEYLSVRNWWLVCQEAKRTRFAPHQLSNSTSTDMVEEIIKKSKHTTDLQIKFRWRCNYKL